MSLIKSTVLLGLLGLASTVAGHGLVLGIVADGTYYPGYNTNFQYQRTPPVVAGWTTPKNEPRGYINDYNSPDIICHLDATPGQAYATVSAGGSVTLQWTEWPVSHHGPVMDYLANCNGECTDVDKTKLLWNKIDEAGLNDGSVQPGNWASDDMIANNNSWTVTIPSSIAPGKYVLRHETIALHSAFDQEGENGAQNYPQCINLEITGSGSNSLSGGTAYNKLYTRSDPGILINIYRVLTSYIIPGPPVIDGAAGGSQPSVSVSASSSAAAATTTSSVATSAVTTSLAATSRVSYSTRGPFSNSTISSSAASTVGPSSLRPTTFATVTTRRGRPSRTTSITITAEPSGTKIAIPSVSSSVVDGDDDVSETTTLVIADPTASPTFGSGKQHKFVCYEEV